MRRIFVDSSHFIAIINPRDKYHSAALRAVESLRASSATFVTSEAIALEVLAYFSHANQWYKSRATAVMLLAFSDALYDVRDITSVVRPAMALYGSRIDQPYSLTDCATMEICRELNITEILTADTDFEREGFTILLKP